jgi:hypothetical protein
LFLKIGLRAPVLANSGEKILEINLGKRRRLCGRHQRRENKCRRHDRVHERILARGYQLLKKRRIVQAQRVTRAVWTSSARRIFSIAPRWPGSAFA